MTTQQLAHLEQRMDDLHAKLAARPEWSRVWDVSIKSLIPVVIAIGAWGIGHEVRLSNMELTAMTKSDGHALHDRVMSNSPPAWLREDMKELKQMMRDSEKRLRAIELKVQAR